MRWIVNELRELKKKGLQRKPVCIESSDGAGIFIGGQKYINFSSNDYLGLSGHPEIIKAAANSLKEYGLGSGASRLLSGTYTPHKELEKRLAQFKKTGSALVFNTGYSANTGMIPALTGPGAVIFSDELNHASIIDGIRLSKSAVKIFRHRDMEHLEKLLKQACHAEAKKTGKTIKKLIITDTVFSMDGDIAPLREIVFLSKKYNAMLMIDDAHAAGVLGETGRGGLEHFDLRGDGVIQMGTLSKAFGCFGGFAAGSKNLTDFLMNRARSFIYSTSLPPSIAEACIKSIDIVETRSDGLRKKLWKNRQRLFEGMKSIGYDTLESETPIIPLFTGDVQNTLKVGKYLFKQKIFALAIRPPTVPHGKCRIRFSVTAAHTDEDIDYTLEKLKGLGKDLG